MGKIKKPNGLHPKKRRLDCYAYACNLNKPQDYVGQIAGYEDKDVFSKEEVIERLIADMLEEDVYVREASYEETPSDWEWKICIFSVDTTDENEYDYHFLREDQPRRWSHKFRGKKPTDKDIYGATITDPRLAEVSLRYNYKFVGFFILCPL